MGGSERTRALAEGGGARRGGGAQRDVVGLQLLERRGLGVRQDDGGEALSRGGVGAVVDAGDAGAERYYTGGGGAG
ncbi:MAG: hypothetical protein CMI16_03200 [Opitutaceae bacterium]|nr:hypothetical protein [Opitutaceae bacterium]